MKSPKVTSLIFCLLLLFVLFTGCPGQAPSSGGPGTSPPITTPGSSPSAGGPGTSSPITQEPTPGGPGTSEPTNLPGQEPTGGEPGTSVPTTQPTLYADTVFINGKVVTMESAMPQAEALAVHGGDILAVGSNDDIRTYIGPATEVIDLDGKALLPGFVDPHTHLFNDAASAKITLEEAQQIALSRGITALADMYVVPWVLQQMQAFEQHGKLDIRTSLYLCYNTNRGTVDAELGNWYQNYKPDRDPASMLRIIGVKIFCDGGSYLRPAFSMDLPASAVLGGTQGDLFLTQSELAEIVRVAQAAGFQVAIHAIGDRGIETALNAIGAALNGQPNTYRHRIEHNCFIRPELLARYSELGIVATLFCPTPLYLLDTSWYGTGFLNLHGASVRSWFQPYRSLLEVNPDLHVAWHSDWPYTDRTPLNALWGLVTRQQLACDGVSIYTPPDWITAEGVTVEEALRMMTIDAAYAIFMEDKIGSLKPGKFADLIVLSDSPLTVDPDSILDLKVLLTMVGGKVKYAARS